MDHVFKLGSGVTLLSLTVETPCATCGVWFGNHMAPIAGGSAAAAAPLIALLVPLLIQELPTIIGSASKIVDLIRHHPDTPAAEKAAMDAAFSHLDAAAAAVAAVQV